LLPAPELIADDVLFAGRAGKFEFGHNVQAFDLASRWKLQGLASGSI